MGVEPVPHAPAAVADLGGQRGLLVADYHAGIERALRREGVELADGGDQRRDRLLELLDRTDSDRLVVLGDLVHSIGNLGRAERAEVEALVDALAIPLTVVKGNHDGVIEPVLDDLDHDITVTPTTGARLGPVGVAHGHTWPAREVVTADVVCIGHEHPVVRLVDEVGGSRMERVWLRGGLNPATFRDQSDTDGDGSKQAGVATGGPEIGCEDGAEDGTGATGELVVFPAFNDLSGGTWVNVAGQTFLSPFLPEGLVDGEAYLLDGTRLGSYRAV